MSNTKFVAGVVVALTLGLLPDTAEAAAPTVFKSLNTALGQLPESITTDDDGNIYLSMGTTVGKITPAGVLSTFADIPIDPSSFVTGLKFGDDGHLYAGSAGFAPVPSSAFVWRISPSGAYVEEYAALDGNGFPNDLAFDDDGNLYVTDPFLAQIWKIDECDQQAEVWLESPLLAANFAAPYLGIAPFGVDGIAFDKNYKNLYVGNLDYGRIVKIRVKDGAPSNVSVFYENLAMIGGVDGIAFDEKENLFLAVHGQDRIVSIDKKGKATNVHTGAPLQQPSSLVFGATEATENTLYISNFSILAVFGVKPGPPTPGLLKLNVQNEGLSLP